jgi:hypothetical protein
MIQARIIFLLGTVVLTGSEVAGTTPEQPRKVEEWKPPTHVDSPDKRFVVEIQQINPDAKSLDRLIIIRDAGKEIARQKTVGYLLNVFWDDTGRYVAINNRRANAGDYVWIFSLPDGKCIKTADSGQFRFLMEPALNSFKRLDARATDQKLEKIWIRAKGWFGSGKLLVQVAAKYGYQVGKFPAHFVYDAQVSINDSKFGLASGAARKVDYLSD